MQSRVNVCCVCFLRGVCCVCVCECLLTFDRQRPKCVYCKISALPKSYVFKCVCVCVRVLSAPNIIGTTCCICLVARHCSYALHERKQKIGLENAAGQDLCCARLFFLEYSVKSSIKVLIYTLYTSN